MFNILIRVDRAKKKKKMKNFSLPCFVEDMSYSKLEMYIVHKLSKLYVDFPSFFDFSISFVCFLVFSLFVAMHVLNVGRNNGQNK